MSDSYFLGVEPYQSLLTSVKLTLSCSEGIIKICGPDGVGKSTIGKKLEYELVDESYLTLFLDMPELTPAIIQQQISRHFNINKGGEFTGVLSGFIEESQGENGLVLIFDNAQQMDVETLSYIRVLGNIQNQRASLVKIILLGDTSLDKKLEKPQFRFIAQFISDKFTLRTMSLRELEDFSRESLYRLKSPRILLSQPELKELYKVSKGYPARAQVWLENYTRGLLQKNMPGGISTNQSPALKNRFHSFVVSLIIFIFVAGSIYFYSLQQEENIETQSPSEFTPDLNQSGPSAQIASDQNIDKQLLAGKMSARMAQTQTSRIEENQQTDLINATSDVIKDTMTDPIQTNLEYIDGDGDENEGLNEAVSENMASMLDETEILMTLKHWLSAWEKKDTEQYFSSYHPDFEPAGYSSLDEWRQARKQRLDSPGTVEIISRDFVFEFVSNDLYQVTFTMEYRRGEYADSTLKELFLKSTGGSWLINSEKSLVINRLE